MTTSETPPVKPDTKRTVPPHLIVPSKRAHEMLVQALDDLLTEAEATQPHETSYMRAAKKALSVARGESSDDQTQPLLPLPKWAPKEGESFAITIPDGRTVPGKVTKVKNTGTDWPGFELTVEEVQP